MKKRDSLIVIWNIQSKIQSINIFNVVGNLSEKASLKVCHENQKKL